MIELVTGAPGAGKSFYAVRAIVKAIRKGRPVATNVPLKPDWSQQLAEYGRHKWKGDAYVAERAERFSRLVFMPDPAARPAEQFAELLRVRLRGEGEERGDMVLDEAHRWMNTRAWDTEVGMTRDEAIEARLRLIAHFSGHRHYGLKVTLLSQDEKNIDRQVRDLYEHIVRIKNLKRHRPLGIPIFPFNLFVAQRFWNDQAKTKESADVYMLDKFVANFYDTHALAGVDHPADAIWLPRSPKEKAA